MFSSHFSTNNIPFGIASSDAHPKPSAATRYEDTVIFLDKLAENGLLKSLPAEAVDAFSQPVLNDFAALPKSIYQQTRSILQSLLSEKGTSSLPNGTTALANDVTMHLPVSSRDFTDFSCSKDHVLNAGEAIQGKRYLPPGFLYFPIGYSGRTSSLVVSGTPVVRPKGQYKNADGNVEYGPTQGLDYELEMACVVGKPSELGKPVDIKDADDYIFGLVILNDWSARDIQGFEMPPLGPLNGKSFGTSVSPWIITLDALKESAIKGITREIPVASHLSDPNPVNSYDIRLKAELLANGTSTTICETNLSSMYWSFRDMIVHQTSNGCSVRTGDLLATGTISGSTHESHGCLLELTKGGQKSFAVGEGAERVYLQDGDAVRISALASEGVGFGECTGKILPAV
ncbi:fumarylacetoacetate hydrolase protein [Rutstroemia sp. NJR-2017a WRK4]|nr:fumarylacetoacetate hydrolase protein [Rutstroemia sp. NJR-2017a WRK4]